MLKKGVYKPYLTKSANISAQKVALNQNRSRSRSSNSKSPISNFRFTADCTPDKLKISKVSTSQKSSNQKYKKPVNEVRRLYQSQSTGSFNIKKVSRDFSSNRLKPKSKVQ